MKEQIQTPALSPSHVMGAGLLFCLILHLALRIFTPPHTTTWDEAMNLLSTEAFLQGSDHSYAYWFWRHPPLYRLLLIPLHTFPHPDWISRIHLLNLALGGCTLVLLHRLVYRCQGSLAAFCSALAYAVLPGTRFYDIWIKEDILVHPLGLLCLLFLFQKRLRLSALFFALALLTKETAALYAFPLAAFTFQHWKNIPFSEKCAFVLITLGLCLPWYLFRGDSLLHFFSFATGIQLSDTESWHAPWYTYFQQLPILLGPAGIFLLICGLPGSPRFSPKAFPWAFWMIVPGLFLLSLLKGKPAWLIIPFLPAFAAAIGSGLARCLQPPPGPSWIKKICIPLGTVALAGLGLWIPRYNAAQMLTSLSPTMAWGAGASAEAAELIHTHVPPDAPFAAAPMYYWEDYGDILCPILLVNLRHWPAQRVNNPTTAAELRDLIHKLDIKWLLISPPPEIANELLLNYITRGNLRLHQGQGALLLDCRNFNSPDSPPPL